MFRALSLLCLLWGFNWVVMKVANEFFSPSFFAMLRFSTGAAILLMVTVIKQIPLPQKRYWPWIIFTGATQIAFCNAAMQTSLQTLGAGLAAMLNYTMPIWVAILARVFLQEKLSGRKVAGIVLSISGLGLLLNVESSGDWYAIMLALSAAMVWAVGNVAMKGKLMGCDLTSLTAWQMTVGAVVLAVYNVFVGEWYAEWNALSIACVAYNGALASAVAFMLWCYLIKHMEASKAAISSLAVPVVGIVSGIVFLGESLTLAMGMGMLLVFAGIVLAQKG
ncbi:MAG: DMT family transporter [Selenomonas sp.]|nr:DMT family transporter [Selenomonas sp.]